MDINLIVAQFSLHGYHIWFVQSSAAGYLDYFQFFTITHNHVVNIFLQTTIP